MFPGTPQDITNILVVAIAVVVSTNKKMHYMEYTSPNLVARSKTHHQACGAFCTNNGCVDPLDFSPILVNKANVLLNSCNSIFAEPSPSSFSINTFGFSNCDQVKCSPSEVQERAGLDKADFSDLCGCDDLLAFDEDFQIFPEVSPSHTEVSETYSSPFYYTSELDQSYSPEYASNSASPHAISQPIFINSSCESHFAKSRRESWYQSEDPELSKIIEHVTIVSSESSGFDKCYADLVGNETLKITGMSPLYKSKQEVFDEILRECEQRYVVDMEVEIRSSDSVLSSDRSSVGMDHQYDYSYDAESEPDMTNSKRLVNVNIVDDAVSSADSSSDDRNPLHAKKKDQNRIAASRYRSKRRSQQKSLGTERHRLEIEHAKLKKVVEETQSEIVYLKKFMSEIRQKMGMIGALP